MLNMLLFLPLYIVLAMPLYLPCCNLPRASSARVHASKAWRFVFHCLSPAGKVPAEAPVDPDSTVWGYLSGALGRVMGNEGPKDQSRPDFKKTYRKGYTGNVNTQSRGDRSRGFHSRIF